MENQIWYVVQLAESMPTMSPHKPRWRDFSEPQKTWADAVHVLTAIRLLDESKTHCLCRIVSTMYNSARKAVPQLI